MTETREQIEERRAAAQAAADVILAQLSERQAQVNALRAEMRQSIAELDVYLMEIEECNVLLINPELFQRIGGE